MHRKGAVTQAEAGREGVRLQQRQEGSARLTVSHRRVVPAVGIRTPLCGISGVGHTEH